MFLTIYYFPKDWIETMHKVLKEDGVGIEFVKEYPRDDSKFTEICFECHDAGDIMLLGYRICFYDLSKSIEEKAMPQVLKNLENFYNSVTKTSEN